MGSCSYRNANAELSLMQTVINTLRSYRYYYPHVLPFALFALFTYIPTFFDLSQLTIYPIKTSIVALSLIYYWKSYKHEIEMTFDWIAVLSGIAVFFIWIFAEGRYPQIGYSEFNPYAFKKGSGVYFAIAFRLIGAALVVPLMEELFWRSFALRFVIKPDFKSISLGHFSWFSFIFVSIVFGFEHHRWLVGIVAGMVYAGLLYRRKNLFDSIVSHSVTNFLLGIYVLATQQWSFW